MPRAVHKALPLLALLTFGCDGSKPDPADSGEVVIPRETADTADTAEDCTPETWYIDADADGFGDDTVGSTESCEAIDGWTTTPGDCDDTDPAYHEDCPEYDCDDLGVASHPESDDTGAALIESQYWVCHEDKGWSESNQFCYDTFDGAYLSALNLAGERETIASLGEGVLDTDQLYWLGLQQESTSPADYFGWFWNNAQGVPDNLTIPEGGLWHAGQPNNGGYDENAGGDADEDVGALVHRVGDWGMDDVIVDQVTHFVCEKVLSE